MSFSEFIVNYWEIISTLFLGVLSVVLIILKKSKIVTLPEGFVNLIISSIYLAEVKFGSGNGSKKLDFVISYVKRFYPTADDDAIKEQVEAILSTPSKKKGGFGRDE